MRYRKRSPVSAATSRASSWREAHEPVERRALLGSARGVGDVAVHVDRDRRRTRSSALRRRACRGRARRSLAGTTRPCASRQRGGPSCAVSRALRDRAARDRAAARRAARDRSSVSPLARERQRAVAHHDAREPAVLEAPQRALRRRHRPRPRARRRGARRARRDRAARRGRRRRVRRATPARAQPLREERRDAAERQQHVREATGCGAVASSAGPRGEHRSARRAAASGSGAFANASESLRHARSSRRSALPGSPPRAAAA